MATKESISSVTGTHGATGKTTNSFAGKWALITGASSGLGLEFADLLAAQKANLVLAARRQEPMEQLASELRRKYGVDVLVEVINLASPGAASRSSICSSQRRSRCSTACCTSVKNSVTRATTTGGWSIAEVRVNPRVSANRITSGVRSAAFDFGVAMAAILDRGFHLPLTVTLCASAEGGRRKAEGEWRMADGEWRKGGADPALRELLSTFGVTAPKGATDHTLRLSTCFERS